MDELLQILPPAVRPAAELIAQAVLRATRRENAALLQRIPAIQRRRNAISDVWMQAMNALESGWEPPPGFVEDVQAVGQMLAAVEPIHNFVHYGVREQIALAVRDGRLPPPPPINDGLSAWPILAIPAAVAVAIMASAVTLPLVILLVGIHLVDRMTAEQQAAAARIAQGLDVPFNPNAGAVGRTFGPWFLAAALGIAALVTKPWQRSRRR